MDNSGKDQTSNKGGGHLYLETPPTNNMLVSDKE